MYISFNESVNQLAKRYSTEYLDNYFEQRIHGKEGDTFVAFTAEAPETIDIMKWGFLSEKTKGKRIGIAKGKGIVKDPYFYIAIRQQRCIIPATSISFKTKDGIVEFHIPDEPIFSIAGVYSEYQYKETSYRSFAITTIEANKSVLPYSDFMPLTFTKKYEDSWLKSSKVLSGITSLIKLHPDKEVKLIEHRTQVNPAGQLGSKSPGKSKLDNNISLEPWWKKGK